MNPASSVGIVGATSLVGGPLTARLAAGGRHVHAVSRSPRPATAPRVTWHAPGATDLAGVEAWVALCPVWIVPEWLPWLARAGCRRLVAVSSMSVVAKAVSPDRHERAVAARLAAAEAEVTRVATAAGVGCVLLRPTMIYDGVRDGNVAAIAAFIRRWGCFPLAGPARGLRQPVHAEDVAAACEAALVGSPPDSCYALSGRTPLPFRDLVTRIFASLGVPPRMPCLPPPLFRAALAAAHACGLGRGVSAGMVARMNEDLSCGHGPAARDLGFRPREFTLGGPQEIGPS